MYNLCKIDIDKDNKIYIYHPLTDEILATNNKKVRAYKIGADIVRRYYKSCSFKYSVRPIFRIPIEFEFKGKHMDMLVPVIVNDCVVVYKDISKVHKNFLIFK